MSDVPARPEQFTLEFLQRVLDDDAASSSRQKILSFSWKPMEVGVISEVVALQLEVGPAHGDGAAPTEQQLIAKFLRPEFPFERMFVVESNFYKSFANPPTVAAFPFALPRAVFLSTHLIIMERVPAIKTYSCVDGCPEDQILSAVTTLAHMHGRFWSADCAELSPSAGIGSELSADAKQTQFPTCWQSFVDDIPLPDADRQRITQVCEALSAQPERVGSIHDAVGNGPKTLIHGDFHTANLLFPSTQDGNQPCLWLVDWATCGRGNPMRDLAFFFMVGVRSEHRAVLESASLQAYYDAVTSEGVTHLSLDEWKEHYRVCVLNQLITLAVYDNLSKHLANNATSEKLRDELHAHFREVNYRSCYAVLDHFDEQELARLYLTQ